MEKVKQKVFVIGFQKTGTTTLELVLKKLGYRVDTVDKNLIKFQDKDKLKVYIKNKLKDFDAVQDMAWPLVYKELYELYPEAKFILTYRSPESWIKSVVKYFASIKIPYHKKIYNVPYAEGYENEYLAVYNSYNNEVKSFFKNKGNFLVMTMGENFNYKTLYGFLEVNDIPKGDFPRSRSNIQKLSNYKIYRDIRSAYINWKKGYK